MKSHRIAGMAVALVLLAAGDAHADEGAAARTVLADALVVRPLPLEQGGSATVEVTLGGAPVAGIEVFATYAPGSELARAVSVGRTGSDGTVRLVPDAFGLVKVEADHASETISVRAAAMPLGGLAVFVFAAGLLCTICAAGFRGIFARGTHLP